MCNYCVIQTIRSEKKAGREGRVQLQEAYEPDKESQIESPAQEKKSKGWEHGSAGTVPGWRSAVLGTTGNPKTDRDVAGSSKVQAEISRWGWEKNGN